MTGRHVHAVRAETDQELLDHVRVRAAFTQNVLNDDRTRSLFGLWGETYKLDDVIALLIPILDRAADRAHLSSRAEFENPAYHQRLVDVVPDTEDRARLIRAVKSIEHRLLISRPERALQAQGFVVGVLYNTVIDEEVPIRVWLGDHLVRAFEVLAYGRLWDRPVAFTVSDPGRLPPDQPTGRRGKRSGPNLKDYAQWYYRNRVADPRVSETDLANERLEALGNPKREWRDKKGLDDRADTKTIRYGIAKARRLLELPVPPEHWTAYFDEFLPDRGGKIPS